MESTLYAIARATLGLLIVVFAQALTLRKRVGKLSRIDAKLDVLLKHAGIEFDRSSTSAKKQAAQLVRSGLTVAQAAEAMGVSTRTAERLWTYAKAWLFREVRND